MELRHLKYFLVLAEELHFGKAAQRLFISQPPLSRQIKALEEELGVELFTRTKKRVQLTIYGQYLQQEAARIFQQLDMVKQHLSLLKEGARGQVRISYVTAAMYFFLPRILTRLRQDSPHIHILLSELSTEQQIRGLKNRELDIAFIRPPLQFEGLTVESLYREGFSLILSADHPLAASATVQLQELANEPFISFTRQCAPRMVDQQISICNRAGFSPKILHVGSINSLLRLVESNLGFSIVPASVQSGYDLRVKFIQLEDIPEKVELLLAYDSNSLTPLSRKVIHLIRQQASQISA